MLDIAELYASTLQRRAGVLAGSAALGFDVAPLGFDVAPLGYTIRGGEGSLPPHALSDDIHRMITIEPA